MSKNCILGVSSFGHDTSACLIDCSTQKILFASAQERYSNIKFDDNIPFFVINECIKLSQRLNYKIVKAAISCDSKLFIGDYFFSEVKKIILNKKKLIDYVNFIRNVAVNYGYYNIFHNKNKLIDNFFEKNLSYLTSKKIKQLQSINTWYFNWAVKHKKIHDIIQKFLGKIDLIPVSHHLSHAAAVYFNSGFSNSNILIMDGQGEQDTITIYSAKNNNFSLLSKTAWPHSLGIFYLSATKYLGYELGDEYKMMGMSAYGKNTYKKYFDYLFRVTKEGQLIIDENQYLGFERIKGTNHKFINFKKDFLNILPKVNNNNFSKSHFNFANTIQNITERIGVELGTWAFHKTKMDKICIGGGVALNGLMNNKVLNLKFYKDAFVYPASGDDGTSVGAALYLLNKEKKNKFKNQRIYSCFYGKKEKLFKSNKFSFDKNLIKNLHYKKLNSPHQFIAKKISSNYIVAVYNNGSEFGPRALGARSILANPNHKDMKNILNARIKLREKFRPFAPACLDSFVKKFFYLKNKSHFMLFICKVKKSKIKLIESVVHHDGTARVQSVTKDNKYLYKILKSFYKITKIPMLINTSFNVSGEAIVNSIEDAILSFKYMNIDYLVIDDVVFYKKDQKTDNVNLQEFISSRKKRFSDKNRFPLYSIGYMNSNFYSNFLYFFRSKLKEVLLKFFL
jgi:carbamoyltransferase